MWLVTYLSTQFDLLLFVPGGSESLQCQSTKLFLPAKQRESVDKWTTDPGVETKVTNAPLS